MSEWISTKEHLPENSGIYFVVERVYDPINYVDHICMYRNEINLAYFFMYCGGWEWCVKVPSECSPDFWMEIPFVPQLSVKNE